MANRDALESLDPSDPAYDTTLQNIAISNGELATAGTLLKARVRGEAHAVLTEEQSAKLERGKARMKDRMRSRFDRG
jgi:t-SNARE complex subunit (syntaxin)